VPADGYPEAAESLLERTIQIFEWHSLKILAGCFVIGWLLRLVDIGGHVQRWVEAGGDSELKRDFILPSHVLGGVVLLALIVSSVVGCYAYYPPPKTVLKEMFIAKGEALNAALVGNEDQASYWIDVYAEWSRKLEVGTFLRHGSVSEYHHWKARLLREQLELLEHAVEDGETEETRQWVAKLQRTHSRLSTAFKEELESPMAGSQSPTSL
jgi:hypothetical protein